MATPAYPFDDALEPDATVVDRAVFAELRARRAEPPVELEARLTSAERAVAALTERVTDTVGALAIATAERDRLAELVTERDRELTARRVAEAHVAAALATVREQLDVLRAEEARREERDAALASAVREVAEAARAAREDVEAHAEARRQAEAALERERERLAALEAELAEERARALEREAAMRGEIGALHEARDRALEAEAQAAAARHAELEALRAARDRLRAAEPSSEPGGDGLVADLAAAAQRLREATPVAEEGEEPASAEPAEPAAESTPPPSAAEEAPTAAKQQATPSAEEDDRHLPPAEAPRRGPVRRFFRRLRGRRD